jgi:hypothetical protein
MASIVEEFKPFELNYQMTFDTIVRIIEMYEYETKYLAEKSGMPKHEMWEMRKAASEELLNLFTQYMREQVYR